ncbi:cysteate racemase [Imhoffiella purpurea]|uniref:Aspartate racemase n=1 Tax=Imhoffiella purpurea TaxID=1249627 RepID=W9V656_9GAMM|nr:amino acid racemase [Imhoffiella purpurea]EXJ14834.1 Aspartate racemase [Imhoffiella purpurea]
MPCLGVLGGMGPAATVDFMSKLVALTPASHDQEHLPVLVASLPQIPDRSAAILGQGKDPLPALLEGLRLLNQAGVGLITIPCATSHHWYDNLSAQSKAPILHIARATAQRIAQGGHAMLLATRGTIASGFFRDELIAQGMTVEIPDPETEQITVDDCIRLVKEGRAPSANQLMERLLERADARGIRTFILGCTELPLAARGIARDGLTLIDSTLELARQAVEHGLRQGWNRQPIVDVPMIDHPG